MAVVWAVVKHTFEGIHHYPQASGEHEYLKYPHRHLFVCRIYIEQFHNDRDIEYLAFKSFIQNRFPANALNDLGSKSCEDIAGILHDYIFKTYEARRIKIEVKEDDENGVFMEF